MDVPLLVQVAGLWTTVSAAGYAGPELLEQRASRAFNAGDLTDSKCSTDTDEVDRIFGFHENSVAGILDSVSELETCDSQCCKDLQFARQPENIMYAYQLFDSSSQRRVIGHSMKLLPAVDGRPMQCQLIENNEYSKGGKYCQKTVTRNFTGSLVLFDCVPLSCTREDLNALTSARPLTIESSYDYCLSTTPVFAWYEIFGWVFLGVWALFLLVSPINEIRISNVTRKLCSMRQSPAALKSIHGIRVLSLCWVCLGHTWSQMYASKTSNGWDYFLHHVQRHPATMWMVNATVSVDSFFLMGGVVAAYVFTRKLVRNPDMPRMEFFVTSLMSYLGRFLRLTPNIMALCFLAVTILYHGQEEPLFVRDSTGYTMTTFGDECLGWEWARVSFFLTWTAEAGCNGWLWYVGNEYWMFLAMPLVVACFSKSRALGLSVVTVLCTIAMASSTAVASIMGRYLPLITPTLGKEAAIYVAAHPYDRSQGIWTDIYFTPWYRMAPYFVGTAVGYYLAVKLSSKKIGETESTKEKTLKSRIVDDCWIAVILAGMLAIVYFPIPVLHDDFGASTANNFTEYAPTVYSPLVAAIYEGCNRGLWGILLGALIIMCETGRGGWISEILSSNIWLIPSRLNFSAYLVHYYVLFAIVEYVFMLQYYMSTAFTLMVCFVTSCGMYFGGYIFYVLFEAPLAYFATLIMKKVQEKLVK